MSETKLPSVGAMNAAMALYPNGVGHYCFKTEELNQLRRVEDWTNIARRIDECTGVPEMTEKLQLIVDDQAVAQWLIDDIKEIIFRFVGRPS